MLVKMVSKTIDVATLPARTMVRSSLKALETTNLMPEGLEKFKTQMLDLLEHFDDDYHGRVDNMTEDERELATVEEIKTAEHHLSNFLVSMLRLVRLATADESRVIEHKPAG